MAFIRLYRDPREIFVWAILLQPASTNQDRELAAGRRFSSGPSPGGHVHLLMTLPKIGLDYAEKLISIFERLETPGGESTLNLHVFHFFFPKTVFLILPEMLFLSNPARKSAYCWTLFLRCTRLKSAGRRTRKLIWSPRRSKSKISPESLM